MSFCWCAHDSNLLISTGKDNRLICWNPNNPQVNNDIVYELPTIGQWCFDTAWCKRNPNLMAAASLEGQVNVYSLMGGKYNVVQQTSSKIMDSFGDMAPSTNSVQVAQQQQVTQNIQQVTTAPKWMRRSCGASFAFGGKLATFGAAQLNITGAAAAAASGSEDSGEQQQQQQPPPPAAAPGSVTICQVVTDSELVDKSRQLETCLQAGNLVDYCNYKVEATSDDPTQASVWKFIMVYHFIYTLFYSQ